MTNPVTPPKRRGCLFYGCVTLVLCSFVFVALGVLAFWWVSHTIKSFTSTQPAQIESVEVSPEQLRQVKERVAKFAQALDAQQTASELTLSADDVNALISADPEFKQLKGKVFMRIEGDRVRGRVNIPLEDIGPFKLKGRYLDGEAAFGFAFTNGQLFVGVREVIVRGRPLPATFMAGLRNENLAQEFMKEPQAAQSLQKFESIEVKDGKIIVRNKVKQ